MFVFILFTCCVFIEVWKGPKHENLLVENTKILKNQYYNIICWNKYCKFILIIIEFYCITEWYLKKQKIFAKCLI